MFKSNKIFIEKWYMALVIADVHLNDIIRTHPDNHGAFA
jgi:hypothetical protein